MWGVGPQYWSPMWQFSTTDPCSDDEVVCNYVLDTTNSEKTAWLVDFLIGTPLRVIGLFILFFVLR